MVDRILSDDDIEQFETHGYVIVPKCFSHELAERWTARAFERLGYDRHDPTTWREGRVHLPSTARLDIRAHMPRLWAAQCQLLGGEARVRPSFVWDSFIVNLREGMDRPWEGPSQKSRAWHVDGDAFRHFLDSPEHALTCLFAWTPTPPRCGGTFVACDSVPIVARFLADHPEGVLPADFPFDHLIAQCQEFAEITARQGDVALLHPFLLHTGSQNHFGLPRVMSNPPVQLTAPMDFARPDLADRSPVERMILRGLGVERHAFVPSGPRENIVPPRRAEAERMRAEERAQNRSSP